MANLAGQQCCVAVQQDDVGLLHMGLLGICSMLVLGNSTAHLAVWACQQ